MQAYLKKLPNGVLAPDDAPSLAHLQKLKIGEVIRVEYKRPRNYRFHKKFFSLLNYAFDVWEPKGPKNFEEFRRNITILAGHREAVTTIKGEVIYRAKSVSFADMDEDTFADFYNEVVDVLLKWVLRNYSKEDVENVMNEIAEYA